MVEIIVIPEGVEGSKPVSKKKKGTPPKPVSAKERCIPIHGETQRAVQRMARDNEKENQRLSHKEINKAVMRSMSKDAVLDPETFQKVRDSLMKKYTGPALEPVPIHTNKYLQEGRQEIVRRGKVARKVLTNSNANSLRKERKLEAERKSRFQKYETWKAKSRDETLL